MVTAVGTQLLEQRLPSMALVAEVAGGMQLVVLAVPVS